MLWSWSGAERFTSSLDRFGLQCSHPETLWGSPRMPVCLPVKNWQYAVNTRSLWSQSLLDHIHHVHVHHVYVHVHHVHVHIIFEIIEPLALQKYNIHWVFKALCICLCICLCVCHWHRQMTADIILCPAVYDMWGLAWSWDDIKGLYSKSWSDDRQTRIQIFNL